MRSLYVYSQRDRKCFIARLRYITGPGRYLEGIFPGEEKEESVAFFTIYFHIHPVHEMRMKGVAGDIRAYGVFLFCACSDGRYGLKSSPFFVCFVLARAKSIWVGFGVWGYSGVLESERHAGKCAGLVSFGWKSTERMG